MGDILTELEAKDPIRAGVLCIQLLKALHQVSIDQGSWDVAVHYLPSPDPCGKRKHGGEDFEGENIAASREAQLALDNAHKSALHSEVNTEEGEVQQ